MFELPLKKTVNSDKFRQPAIFFEKHGVYTFAPPGTSEYIKYWTDEMTKCQYGYTAPDGDWVSGYFYFYLNYTRIIVVKDIVVDIGNGRKRKRRERVESFPYFWDYDRAYYDAIELAETHGKHLAVIKARGKGYSFKGASMLVRNYYMFRESVSYAIAAESEFLTKDGLLTKAWDMMDFIDNNTGWYKRRQVKNSSIHKRASFIENINGVPVEQGYKSEIIGISLKNDPQKARGKRGKLILFEEAGKFPNLKTAWQIARPSVEHDGEAFGVMIAFGCVCEGTKVITNNGLPINIEDIKPNDGVLGYNTYSVEKQDIEHFREPYITRCLRLTTNTGRSLEASYDHPIVYSHKTLTKRIPGRRFYDEHMKTWKWKQLQDFKVGDQVGVIEEVPIFGEKEMWNPRFIGWLIGDGSYGFDKTPRLSNCEPEINEYIDKHFQTKIEKRYITKDNKLYRETRVKGICWILRELGIYGQVKNNKRLPDLAFYCTKEDICELLGGLYDTDGYISKPNGSTNAKIILTSSCFALLEQVLFLLNKLGIHGSIRTIKPSRKNKKDKNDYYRLEVGDIKSMLTFAENITLFPKHKKERLAEYKRILSNRKPLLSSYIHGIRFERVVKVEEIGDKKVYNLVASGTHTYIANGIITHNTGGTEEADYTGLKDLFYEPEAYNCLPLRNIWDEGEQDTACGFFVPQSSNIEKFMDSDGNTDYDQATHFILAEREKVVAHASDRAAIDRHICEQPLTPAEATLNISTNMFPKKDLIRHLATIRNSESIRGLKQVGSLYFDSNGKVKFEQNPKLKDLTRHRLQANESKSGAVVIWEHPIDNPPWGLYIGGCDPYDHDTSSTDSLGSVFIYKRVQTFESWYDVPVAEYTGRPDRAETFYETVRMLAMYYGATLLYENEKKGLFTYFTNKHCEYLLADQPSKLKDVIKDLTVVRGKGTHMNKPIKQWMETLIRDWLLEEYEPGRKNLTKLLSEPLLEELIAYDPVKGNFDRVISFGLALIYNVELDHVKIKKVSEEEKIDLYLFKKPLFLNKIPNYHVAN